MSEYISFDSHKYYTLVEREDRESGRRVAGQIDRADLYDKRGVAWYPSRMVHPEYGEVGGAPLRFETGHLWHVLHVRSRCEKKALHYCERFGIDSYLPLRQQTKTFQRRKVTTHIPVFPGYSHHHRDPPRALPPGSVVDRRGCSANSTAPLMAASRTCWRAAPLRGVAGCFRRLSVGLPPLSRRSCRQASSSSGRSPRPPVDPLGATGSSPRSSLPGFGRGQSAAPSPRSGRLRKASAGLRSAAPCAPVHREVRAACQRGWLAAVRLGRTALAMTTPVFRLRDRHRTPALGRLRGSASSPCLPRRWAAARWCAALSRPLLNRSALNARATAAGLPPAMLAKPALLGVGIPFPCLNPRRRARAQGHRGLASMKCLSVCCSPSMNWGQGLAVFLPREYGGAP